MSKRYRALFALIILVLVVAILIFQQPQSDESSYGAVRHVQESSASDGVARHVQESGALDDPGAGRDIKHRARVTEEDWRPPAVFADIGLPIPVLDYPRGANFSRIYQTHQERAVELDPAATDPVVLAKSPEDGRFHLLAEEIDEHTLMARRMVLDPAALDAVLQGQSARILVPSVDEEVIALDIDQIKTRSNQSHTLFGHIEGESEFSAVQLVYHDGIIHGTVTRYDTGQYLEYRMLPDGHMMVRELDVSTMEARCGTGDDDHADCASEKKSGTHQNSETTEAVIQAALGEGVQINSSPKSAEGAPTGVDAETAEAGILVEPEEGVEINSPSELSESAPPEVEAETAGYTTFDITVGYGQEARIAQGGNSSMEALIIASVERMNTAFGNSQITSTEIMLLGTIEDPDYVFGGTGSGLTDELAALELENDGVLNTVSDYAIELGSDLRAFVVKSVDGLAGKAERPGNNSVIARTYMTDSSFTFCHEVGHNLGCRHGWGDGYQTMASNFGWRIEPAGQGKKRTIMAYDWDWDRIPHYSNPAVLYAGEATGAVDGFDVRDQPNADQRYLQGGFSGPDMNLYGFDGNNADLGANNSEVIKDGIGDSDYGAAYAAARATRAVTVYSPAALVNWSTGQNQTIYFAGGDYSDTFDIDLYKGGSLEMTIASGLSPETTDRQYTWTLPGSLSTASNYMIRITLNLSGGGTTTIDSSIFSITNMTANTVAILSPNGGETMSMGDSVPITWTSGLGTNVKIELYKGNASLMVIAASETDDGLYPWIVAPSLGAGSDYRIRISSVNNPAYFDESDANFTINPPANAITLPYTEGFESNFGKWDDTDTQDQAWLRHTGDTPSDFTGPTSGAQSGSYFMYVEASFNYNSIFDITAWVDLRSMAEADMDFYYQMSETHESATDYMGTLDLDISTDGSTWTTIFTRSGDQGSAWLNANVSLDAYTGQFVKLRFRGATKSWYPSDICVDNITINGQSAFEVWSGGGTTIEGDANSDGVSNGMAWVLGVANKNTNADGLLPTGDAASSTDYWIFNYRRSDSSHNDRNTTIFMEYCDDFTNWTHAIHDGSDVIINEIDDEYGAGVDRVEVRLSKSLFSSGRLFGRLKVLIAE